MDGREQMDQDPPADLFFVDPVENDEEILRSTPQSTREIDLRIHALVDIGDFLVGFTIENIGGGHVARARVFELHTRSWLPVAVPIFPSELNGEELPIDGKWEMQMFDDNTILCIYSNPSRCRLIYLHVDRRPTTIYPLTLFVSRSVNIRPVHPSLIDKSLKCTVFYSRIEGVERVTVVTDDYQVDRDSVRVFEMNEEGKMEYIGACNLTKSIDDHMITRSSKGDIILTSNRKIGIFFERKSGGEEWVELEVDPIDEDFPLLKSSSFFFSEYRSFFIDAMGSLWSFDGNRLTWIKHSMDPFITGAISSLSISPNGRVLGLDEFKRKNGGYKFEPMWRWIQPPSLKESTQTSLNKSLVLQDVSTEEIHSRMAGHRRSYDTTNSYYISIVTKPGEELETSKIE